MFLIFNDRIHRCQLLKLMSCLKSGEFACNTGDLSLIPGLGRSPGEGNGYPLQYSSLENSIDRETWWATVPGVLKLNIQKMKIMASGPIMSWEIDGETVETVSDFILGGCKITADGDCSHEIKRRLLLRRKLMNNLDSILKSRDITLPTNVHLVKAMVFPVVMYGCESWTVKKAERQRIDAFELWCWDGAETVATTCVGF